MQLAERLGERTEVYVSGSTLSRTLSKLDITRKQSLKASEVYNEAKQQQRYDYWQSLRDVTAEDLVFLDEMGVNLAMVSLYARAQRGQRAYARAGENLTILGAMSLKAEFLEGLSFSGGMTGDLFLWFIEFRGGLRQHSSRVRSPSSEEVIITRQSIACRQHLSPPVSCQQGRV